MEYYSAIERRKSYLLRQQNVKDFYLGSHKEENHKYLVEIQKEYQTH